MTFHSDGAWTVLECPEWKDNKWYKVDGDDYPYKLSTGTNSFKFANGNTLIWNNGDGLFTLHRPQASTPSATGSPSNPPSPTAHPNNTSTPYPTVPTTIPTATPSATPQPNYYTNVWVWNATKDNSQIGDSTVTIKHNGVTIAVIHGGYGGFGYDTADGSFEFSYDATAPGYEESTGSFNPVPGSTYLIHLTPIST